MVFRATITATLAFLCMSVPVFAAETASAGFAPTSIWISKTNLIEGDSANIFTVLYNSSAASLSGDLIFVVDGTSLGTKHFSIDAGATEVESMSWTARAGSHTLSARIENASDTSTKAKTAIRNEAASSITVAVSAPPPPKPAVATSTGVNGVLPVIENAGKGVYGATESARLAGAVALANALKTEKPATPVGKVLGAQTYKPTSSSLPTANSLMASVWHGALSGLLFIFTTQALFYAALLFMLFMFYKLIRVMFTDRRHRR